MIIELLVLILGGFTAGILSGMIGIGGGLVFVPLLLFLYNPDPGISSNTILMIISTSLFAGSFASSSSAFSHLLHKNIDLKKALLLSVSSGLSAFTVPIFISDFNMNFVEFLLAVILFVVAILLFFDSKIDSNFRFRLNDKLLILWGLIIGFISAAGGIGGGVFYVPVLYYLFGLDVKKSVGTSVTAVSATMIVATISYLINMKYSEEIIYLHAGLILGITAIIGAVIGAGLTMRINPYVIKKIFSLFLIITVIKIITAII
ncbi:MAG: sulfite exporter TauE/SafE family protein [Melioribacteraceae bacterium]|nr:sulfite exporter TauE/SafE family protein [Melioribacteraceae bacterium]